MGNVQSIRIESPVGPLLLAGDDRALTQLEFAGRLPDRGGRSASGELAGAVARAARQIDEYFAGERRTFDVELRLEGTSFQQRVWSELVKIPYGETISYGELARRIERPGAARAVGLANGSNPIAIIVPCHRVIGSNGKLVGFGGGLDTKARLLALERRVRGTIAEPAELFAEA